MIFNRRPKRIEAEKFAPDNRVPRGAIIRQRVDGTFVVENLTTGFPIKIYPGDWLIIDDPRNIRRLSPGELARDYERVDV